MTESDYRRYIQAFNARDYATLESFFADDFALENAQMQKTLKSFGGLRV